MPRQSHPPCLVQRTVPLNEVWTIGLPPSGIMAAFAEEFQQSYVSWLVNRRKKGRARKLYAYRTVRSFLLTDTKVKIPSGYEGTWRWVELQGVAWVSDLFQHVEGRKNFLPDRNLKKAKSLVFLCCTGWNKISEGNKMLLYVFHNINPVFNPDSLLLSSPEVRSVSSSHKDFPRLWGERWQEVMK